MTDNGEERLAKAAQDRPTGLSDQNGVVHTTQPDRQAQSLERLSTKQQTEGQEPTSSHEPEIPLANGAIQEQDIKEPSGPVKMEPTAIEVMHPTVLGPAALATGLPELSLTQQLPLVRLTSMASNVENPLHVNSNLILSDSLQQAAMAQPLAERWPDLTQSIVEPYSSETEHHSLPPSGFAKLEFPDGHFYMTTYAVILGRDMRAWKLAKRQAAVEAGPTPTPPKPAAPTKPHRSASLNDLPQTPVTKPAKINGAATLPRSFVSESGGIIGEEDGHMEVQSSDKRKRKRSDKKSSDSGPSQVVRKHSMDLKPPAPITDLFGGLQPATVDPNVTAKLNPADHTGDPNYVPLIPIHPPTDLDNQGKGISRQHVKIFYSFEHGRFEMEVLGRNGAFLDEQHYSHGSVVALSDRSDIQIGGVNVRFVLPNAPMDGEPTERSESVSGRMSFTFEDSRGASVIASDNDDDPELYDERRTSHYENGFPDEFEDDESIEQSVEQSSEDASEDEEDEPGPRSAQHRRGNRGNQAVQQPYTARTGRKYVVSQKAKDIQATRIKINMSKRQKAQLELQMRAEKRTLAEREAAKRKAAAKAKRESIKKETVDDKPSSKENSKEASKTPAPVGQNDDQSKPVRMARDEAMQNGVDFYDPKLPTGFIVPPRKKGPGRPPKDGVMSKREKALLIKQAKEEEKARRLGLDPSQLPPVDIKPPKPPVRRNSKGEVDQETQEVSEQQRLIRPPKPPRSPSPEMRVEDYTEDQLQRPNANYVLMIYEAIKASSTGKMNLQQIYSAIERRYPYFKFKTTSAGWQSSVRHNLSQHEAFVQVEKDGKGWLWGIKEGVPIERERRKKTPPPQAPPSQQPRYPQSPYPFNGFPIGISRGAGFNYQPPRFFPPSNTQSTEAKSQSYSSPYATDKPSDGTNASAASSTQSRPTYMPPSYSRPSSYAPPASSSTAPSAQQNNASQLTKLSGHRGYRPSADVVDTFRKVFVDSYKHRSAEALAMVNRAINRVLHPESMNGSQPGSDEMTVALAFENCIAKAIGPPRHVAPLGPAQTAVAQQPRQDSPSVAVNIASSAAITAAATAAPAADARSTTPPQPTAAGNQRPAEANLLNLLTGARHSPLPTTSAATNGVPVDAAKIAKMLDQPAAVDGEVKSAPLLKPDVEPLTPPAPIATPHSGTKRAAPGSDDGDGKAKRTKVDT